MQIAIGNSRMDKHWKNVDMSWEEFKERCSQTTRTAESLSEYKKMTKARQDAIKDVGGFVAGNLKEGRRKNGYVNYRSALTLDLDHAVPGVWDTVSMLFDFKCLMYSTHKSTPDNPRVRLVIPLSRTVTADEYPAISRMVAKDIGIEMVDDTCHEPARLMYWPSTSRDGEFLFEEQDGDLLNPDDILHRYTDWHDASQWPVSSRQSEVVKRTIAIHDAIEAGFNHVVFIIRKDIEKEFKEIIGDRIASICSSHNVTVDYAFQDINDIPGELPEGRTKPWGTGQAVLAAKDVIKTPFIVINADDYYGKEGFKAVHEYLVNGGKSCMAGFVLKNTLSDNGGVTRGICKMDENGNLTEVVETKNIVKTADGAEADGVVVDVNSLVSMNMWGLTPDFLDVLEEGFKEFFEKEVPGNPQKAEYLIPIFIGELLEQGKMSVKVLRTNDTWYGMTYHEDVAAVKGSFKEMLENGVYKADLFSDL